MPELPLRKVLSEAFIKIRPERSEIDKFKTNLISLIDGIKKNPTETEEFIKNLISDFLKNTWYSPDYFINTNKKTDLVIHNGDNSMPIGVMIETKSPRNKNEMATRENLNSKAMQELLLYYLRETNEQLNISVKHLIITNGLDWFIFDAHQFYKHFSLNKKLLDLFKDFKSKTLLGSDTNTFYSNIASPYIESVKKEIEFSYINLLDYDKIIRNDDKLDDIKLINLYKVLSPNHLLKKSISNDSNMLNNNFYIELLYIIGLSEKKENGKIIINRIEEEKRQHYSLIENAILELSEDFADEDIIYEVALELNITWINRILFLKLLEAQLIKYNNGNTAYSFLNTKVIKTFNDLNSLFFNVLAVEPCSRVEVVKEKYKNVPYLNSSLFEITENESHLRIRGLANEDVDIFPSTVLIDDNGNRRKGKIKILDYIFEFLDAFDFASEGSEQIQEKHKTLINASVLGLIFEKINGYKDGSFFTPGFITSYICSQTIEKIVIQKFNEVKGWNVNSLDDIYNYIKPADFKEANNIVNSIKILDPAVGSGHFLVSALNELISIKSKLGILVDTEGKRIRGEIEVLNDELIIYDEMGNYFEYRLNVKENQRIQETIFNEKRFIIENCLFGVDINPNSVKICRLRLWIELLKHSFYTKESNYNELETLPNIDINIKNGDSLFSRFDMNDEYIFSTLKYSIKEYKDAVNNYKGAKKAESKKLLDLIKNIKTEFTASFKKQNKLYNEKTNLEKKLAALGAENPELGFVTEKELEEKEKKIEKVKKDILAKQAEIDMYFEGEMFENAFEWRFEFPEVLDIDGNFIGFDAVIGNPPYLREGKISKSLFETYKNSPYYQGKMDIWYLFACQSLSLLKENGILTFIATNNWTTAAGASKLRNVIIENTRINCLIDFTNFMVFENASIQTMIMSFTKDNETDNYNIDFRKLSGVSLLTDALDLLNLKLNNNTQYLSPIITRDKFKDKFLTFSEDEIILNKILERGICLLENELAQGIVPNPDVLNENTISKIPEKKISKYGLKVNDGVFVINKSKFSKLSSKEQKYIKILYEPTSIEKYFITASDKRILYITKKNYKNDAPTLLEHLDKYKEVMEDRRENKNGKLSFFHLHWSRDPSFFASGEKILVPRKSIFPTFAYTEKEAYVMMSVNVIKTKRFNVKYLTGLLNSKLIAFWLKNKGKMQGNNFQLDKEPLINIPIFNPTETQQKPIILLVDKILEAKKENIKSDTTALEHKIDILVYKLYELSDDNISIIESSVN